MNSHLRLLGALWAASALARADAPRIAVFDFQSDRSADEALHAAATGSAVAAILRADLTALAGVEAVPVPPGGFPPLDLLHPLAPADARRLGSSLGATTLVTGQVIGQGTAVVLAAKVVATATGDTLGTVVQGTAATPIADLASRLSRQVSQLALSQAGSPPGAWADATVRGSHRSHSAFEHDETAGLMDIDGRPMPDEVASWNVAQTLEPGLHEVYVRYYDGSHTAGCRFEFIAAPGTAYEIAFEREGTRNPRLWIREQSGGRPVTAVKVGDLNQHSKPLSPSALSLDPGPFGQPSLNYSDTVRPPSNAAK